MLQSISTDAEKVSLKMADFLIQRQMASAKCCTVHSAEWISHKMTVALKVYDKTNMSPGRCHSVRREARMMRTAQRLEIPHIVQIYGLIEEEDALVIVMELCEPMHAHQMVHRDIKLENMFLDSNTAVRLGDFGLTISLKEESSVSQIGTVEYMAPEIVMLPTSDDYQQGRINALEVQGTGTAVDIWALGVSMYELVVIKQNILDNDVLPLPAAISDTCKDFIHSMMTYDRRTRPTAFMLAHHPFIRQHCSPEEILAAGGSPTHPFNQIDWKCSPIRHFKPLDQRTTQPEARRSTSTSSMESQEAKPCAPPATDARVAGPSRAAAAASPASSGDYSSQSSTRSAGMASRSPLHLSLDCMAAQQLGAVGQLLAMSPKTVQYTSEYSKFTANWSNRMGDSSESSKHSSRRSSSRLQPALGHSRSIKPWSQPMSHSASRGVSDNVAPMASE